MSGVRLPRTKVRAAAIAAPPEGSCLARRRLGLIVNPIAGMGGRLGLKGTDGPAVLAKAQAAGAVPEAPARAARALRRLAAAGSIELATGPRTMGEDVARGCGLEPVVVGSAAQVTTAADTRAIAAAMQQAGVELLLFAGGDGTARDLYTALGSAMPILGIPTGVKMHSAVFATSPENAGALAARWLDGGTALREAEVMDIDEEAVRADRLSARLFGYASVPAEPRLMQAAKASAAVADEVALEGACRRLLDGMDEDRLYLLGPGTTTRRVAQLLGLPKTLLGVDAVQGGRLVGADLDERGLLALVGAAAAVTLVIGVVGGQGYLFGRGNQQLSAALLRRIGRENIAVLAGVAKLMALEQRCLRVDTGDGGLDRELAGYLPVTTGPGRSLMMRVEA